MELPGSADGVLLFTTLFADTNEVISESTAREPVHEEPLAIFVATPGSRTLKEVAQCSIPLCVLV